MRPAASTTLRSTPPPRHSPFEACTRRTRTGLLHLFAQTYEDATQLGDLLSVRAAADYDPARFIETDAILAVKADLSQAFVERCNAIVDDALAKGPDEPNPPPDL